MIHRGQIQSGAIVLDVGCAVTRCGFAGEELPSSVIPTQCSTSQSMPRPVPAAASSPRKDVIYASPLELDGTGLIRDWEGVKSLVEYCVFERLGVGSKEFGGSSKKRRNEASSDKETMDGIASALDRSSDLGRGDRDLSEHPILLAEPLYASKEDKKRWCEMLMDVLKAPGVFMTRAGVLSIYANARVTGMSVDIGAGGISILPVQEGFALLGGSIRSPIGGDFLDSEYLQEANSQLNSPQGDCSSQKRRIRPRIPGANVKKKSTDDPNSTLSFEDFHPSIQDYYSLCLARDLKEHVCRILSEAPKSEQGQPIVPTIEYELPDGQILRIGQHRFSVPELIFNPAPVFMKFPGAVGLHNAICKSALACEGDIRRDLLSNIVLTGGSSVIPGLQERLLSELGDSTLPAGCKARISAASESERAHGAWLGGSILASLGTFPDLWLSKDDPNENISSAFYLASSAANVPDGLRVAKKKRRKIQDSLDAIEVVSRRCYPVEDELSLNSINIWPGATNPSIQDIATKTRFVDIALLERVLCRSVVSGWLGSAINMDISDDYNKVDPTISQGAWAHRFVALTPTCLWIFRPHVDGMEPSGTAVVNSSTSVNEDAVDKLKSMTSSTFDKVEPLAGPPALKPEKRLVIHFDSATYGISGSDFQVYSDGLLITLRAASEAEASAWLVHIHSCIAGKRRSSSELTDPAPIALSDNHLLSMAEVALDESATKISDRVGASFCSLFDNNVVKKNEPLLDSHMVDVMDTVRTSSPINMRKLLSHFPIRMRLRAFARRVIPEHVPLLRAWEMMLIYDIHQSFAATLGPRAILKSAIDVFDRFFGRGAADPISLPTDVLHALSLELVRCGPLSQEVSVCPPATLFNKSVHSVEEMIKSKILGPYSRALSCLLVAARQSPSDAGTDVLISSKGGLLRQLSRSSFSNLVTPGGNANESSFRRNSMSPGENPQPVSRRSSLFSVIPDAFAAATTSSRSRSVTRAGSFLSPTSPPNTKLRSKSMVSAADSISSPSPGSTSLSSALNISDVLDTGAADISGFDFDFDTAPPTSIRSALPPSFVDFSLIPRTSLSIQGRGLPSIQHGGSQMSDDFVIESVFSSFSNSIISWRKNLQRSFGSVKGKTSQSVNVLIPNEKIISWVSRRHGVTTERLSSALGTDAVSPSDMKEEGGSVEESPLPAAIRAMQDAATEAVLISHELQNLSLMNEMPYSRSNETSDLSDYLSSALFGELKLSTNLSSPLKGEEDLQEKHEMATLDSRSLVARSSHPFAAALSGHFGNIVKVGNNQSSTSIRTILSGVLMNPSFDVADKRNVAVFNSINEVTKSVLDEIVKSELLRLTPLRAPASRKDRIAALGGKSLVNNLNTQLIAQKPTGPRFITIDGAESHAFLGYPVPVVYSQQIWASFSTRGFSTTSMSPRGLNEGTCVVDISVIPSAGSASFAPKKICCDLNAANYAFASSLPAPRVPGSQLIKGKFVTVAVHADGSLALYDKNRVCDSSDAAWGLFSPPATVGNYSCQMIGLVFLSRALDIIFTNDVALPRHCVDVVMPAGALNLIAIDGDSNGLFDALISASRTKTLTTHALVVQGAKSGGKKVRLQIRSELLSVRSEPSGFDSKISSFVPLPFFLSSSSTGSVILMKGSMYKRGKIRTAFARREMRVTASFTTAPSTATNNSASANSSSLVSVPATDLDSMFQHLRSGPYRVPPFSRSSDQRSLPFFVIRAVGQAALDRAIAAKENPLPSLESLMESVKITEVKLEYSKGAALRGSIVLWSNGATYAIGVVPVVSQIDVKAEKESTAISSVSTATELPVKFRLDSRKKWIGDTSGNALAGSSFFALYTEGRIWQFACDDANEAREWVAIISALCIPRDSAIARTLPKTRPGFSSADESLMKAILINSTVKAKS